VFPITRSMPVALAIGVSFNRTSKKDSKKQAAANPKANRSATRGIMLVERCKGEGRSKCYARFKVLNMGIDPDPASCGRIYFTVLIDRLRDLP
ncbi:MAG TPA: hypothetical protein PL070_11365, partial [Flavobacteriales bacterium]|nr:hypothetical protein [Flavobacteriales bacterium]